MQPLVLFQTGNMQIALDRNCIEDIRPIPTPLIQGQSRIQRHSIEIGGRHRLLIDLAAASSQNIAPVHPPNGKIIVLTGSPPLALLADNVHPAIDVSADQMDELPSVFTGTAKACFPKVLRLEEQVALILETAALAEVETYAAASATAPQARQEEATQRREAAPAAEGAPSNAAPLRIDIQAIEAIIAERLQTIISLHVQEAVVHALQRYMG